MFVDASAIVAIIGGEDDWLSLALRLHRAGERFVSPIVIYEAVTGLARKRACSISEATALVDQFIEECAASVVSIDSEISKLALEAFDRYGRGRHVADLNMGDCFAYACAKARRLPLLFKGDDFVNTDIEPA